VLDPAPLRLAAQVAGQDVTPDTLFALTTTTPVSFRFMDSAGNIGSATSTVTVVPAGTPDYTLSADKSSAVLNAGQSTTFTITLTPSNGFNSSVSFACVQPLAVGISCVFNPAVVTLGSAPASTTLTVSTTGAHLGGIHRAGGAVLWATLGGFGVFGCMLFGWRKRRGAWIAFVIAVLVIAAFAIGCGFHPDNHTGGSRNADLTPSGTQSIQVNATSGATSHTIVLTINVQ
jgi:hypothetical protein